MPRICWWRSAITSIIKRWISTAEVLLQRKLKQFRLSASERERKPRHLMNIFQCVSLSRRICFCRLSMRLGRAFQFGFLQSKPCFLLKNRPWNSCYTEENPISTWHFSHRWIKDWFRLRTSDVKASEPSVIVWFLSCFFHPAANIMLPIQPTDHGLTWVLLF